MSFNRDDCSRVDLNLFLGMPAEAYLTDAATDPCSSRSRSPELHDQRQRNLLNQLNFRPRQKQHVVELEQKIRACEEAGAFATKCVQAAARAVAAENAVLRDLARVRLGWNEQELDHYMLLGVYPYQNCTIDETNSTGHNCHCQECPRFFAQSCEQQLFVSPRSLPLISRTYTSAICKSDNPNQEFVNQGTTTSETETDAMILTKNPKHEMPNEEISSDSCISCEQAAAMLSEFRVQESLELIREGLGCSTLRTCTVKHEKLFQKMDDSV